MKTCKGCGEIKPLDEYHRSSNTKDRRQGKCKVCRCLEARQDREQNPERDRRSQARYYQANRERLMDASRRNYAGNREACLERQRRYNQENWPRVYALKAEQYRAKSRRYYQENQERWREYGARRRAAIGEVSAEVRAHIACLLDHPCAYCGATEDIEVDHVVPLSRGGAHTPENLAPACRACNRSKGAKLLSEWRVD